ncbi:hypothetical protein GCM10022265_02150 [Marinobacter xestospongiae]
MPVLSEPGQRIPNQFYGADVKDPDGKKLAFLHFGQSKKASNRRGLKGNTGLQIGPSAADCPTP